MELYELVTQLPRRQDRHAVHDRPPTTMVGRDRELAIIANARQQVLEGQGRVISISGDAGCGKSRLLHEALKRDAGDWLVLDGQALPYGNKGYRVILDMLGGCFALELGDDTAARSKRSARASGCTIRKRCWGHSRRCTTWRPATATGMG